MQIVMAPRGLPHPSVSNPPNMAPNHPEIKSPSMGASLMSNLSSFIANKFSNISFCVFYLLDNEPHWIVNSFPGKELRKQTAKSGMFHDAVREGTFFRWTFEFLWDEAQVDVKFCLSLGEQKFLRFACICRCVEVSDPIPWVCGTQTQF